MKLRNYNKIISWQIVSCNKETDLLEVKNNSGIGFTKHIKSFKFLQDAKRYVELRDYLWCNDTKIVGHTKDHRRNILTEYCYRFYPDLNRGMMEWVRYPSYPKRISRFTKKHNIMTKSDKIYEININTRCDLSSRLRYSNKKDFKYVSEIFHKILNTFEPRNYDIKNIINLTLKEEWNDYSEYENMESCWSTNNQDCVDYFNSYSKSWEGKNFEEKVNDWIGNVHYWSDRFNWSRIYTFYKQFELLEQEFMSS